VDKYGRALLVEPLDDSLTDALDRMYREFDPAQRSLGLPPHGEEPRRLWLDELRERGTNLVARDGDRVIGHVAFVPVGNGTAELVVFVHQDAQGRGVGSELCRQAVAHAAATGLDALFLSVDCKNEPALAVYRSLGFQPTGQVGCDVEMRLPLTGPALAPSATD